ncbi:MAG: fibronectin type III domain-containing protein [Spirochaetales bacterium]|nr:fibronectin type III domain-containing protein [Spirochaetales bacterium]
MKKKLTFTILNYILIINLFSETLSINEFISDSLVISKGFEGKNYLQIKENEYAKNPFTDLLLHFNTDFEDETDNYTVLSHYNNISDSIKKMGTGSAYFFDKHGISYNSKGDTIFTPGRIIGDFTIEFWINPSVISEDSIIFSWKGVNKVESEYIPQKIKCYFEDRNIVWEFDNFFIPENFEKFRVILKGRTRFIPNQWNHIMLRYDSSKGMIESLVNNIPESIKFSTPTKSEENSIYPPYTGEFSESTIYIGEQFRGFIDEFRISETVVSEPNLTKYHSQGSFVTPVYDIGNSYIENFNIHQISNPETLVTLKYRISNLPFLLTNNQLSWTSIEDFKQGINGRYIQFSGELFSDGKKTITPELEKIDINWAYIDPPPAPLVVSSISLENSIKVEWSPVKYFDIDGYILYYGENSNNYTEMIDVGTNTSYTISNLQSKKIYYFSIKAYKNDIQSSFSIEKFNRPK